jgi:hypothetical protein
VIERSAQLATIRRLFRVAKVVGIVGARQVGKPHLRGRTFQVANAGALGVESPAPGDVSALDGSKLNDVLLHVEYHLV